MHYHFCFVMLHIFETFAQSRTFMELEHTALLSPCKQKLGSNMNSRRTSVTRPEAWRARERDLVVNIDGTFKHLLIWALRFIMVVFAPFCFRILKVLEQKHRVLSPLFFRGKKICTFATKSTLVKFLVHSPWAKNVRLKIRMLFCIEIWRFSWTWKLCACARGCARVAVRARALAVT